MQRDPGATLKGLRQIAARDLYVRVKILGKKCAQNYQGYGYDHRCNGTPTVLLYGKPYCDVHARQELDNDLL